MRKLLSVLSLFLFVGVAFATTSKQPQVLEYKDEQMTVQLYDTPCVNKDIHDMGYPKELLDKSHAVVVTVPGLQLEGCWVANDGRVDIVVETGETGSIPMFVFKVVDPI